jgi:hypothetical protein
LAPEVDDALVARGHGEDADVVGRPTPLGRRRLRGPSSRSISKLLCRCPRQSAPGPRRFGISPLCHSWTRYNRRPIPSESASRRSGRRVYSTPSIKTESVPSAIARTTARPTSPSCAAALSTQRVSTRARDQLVPS